MAVNSKDFQDNGTQFYPVTHVEAVLDGNGGTLDTSLKALGQKIGIYVDSTYSVSTSSSTKVFDVSIARGNEIRVSLFDDDGHVGGSIKFYVKYDGESDFRSGVDVTTSTPYVFIAEKDVVSIQFYKYSPSSAGSIRVTVELVKSIQDTVLDILAKTEAVTITQLENGKYIDNTGTLQTSSSYGVYLVSVPAYTAFYCTARAVSTVCIFAGYSNGTYTPITISSDSSKVGYYYINPSGSAQSIAVCSIKSNLTYYTLLSGMITDIYKTL